MPRVMISYKKFNGTIPKFVSDLGEALRKAGIDTWIDVNDLKQGEKWEDGIYEGIINSDYVLLALSPEYFTSEVCLTEAYIARGYGKKLLPVIIPFEHQANEELFKTEKLRNIFRGIGADEAYFNTRLSSFQIMFRYIDAYIETQGIDHLHILNFNPPLIPMLPETSAQKIQRIIDSIQKPKPENKVYQAYISYKSEDEEFATKVADSLNANGYDTFISTRGVDVGVNWRQVHWNAVLSAKFHVVILSPNIIDSGYVENELRITRTKKDHIFIPILSDKIGQDETLRSAVRNAPFLQDVIKRQWFDLDKGYQSFIKDLTEFIERNK